VEDICNGVLVMDVRDALAVAPRFDPNLISSALCHLIYFENSL